MPLECALQYSDGIKGSNTKRGRAETSSVIEFNHSVYSPTDNQRGMITGARVHGAVEIVKEVDTATPSLFQACCKGDPLDEFVIKWYRINDTGQEEMYFSTTLKGVRVASVENILPNTKDPSKEKQTHLERLKLLYGMITWKHEDGYEYADSWTDM